MCPCRLPDPTGQVVWQQVPHIPRGQPQRKPACSGVLPAVVDWQILDLAHPGSPEINTEERKGRVFI